MKQVKPNVITELVTFLSNTKKGTTSKILAGNRNTTVGVKNNDLLHANQR